MTRFDKGKQDIKEMAKLICDFIQEGDEEAFDEFCCDRCPWTNYCSMNHNGVEVYSNFTAPGIIGKHCITTF